MKPQSMNKEITCIEKRAIEAMAIVPVIREVSQKIGWEETLSILQDVNQQEAFERGQNLAKEKGSNGIEELVGEVAEWGLGGVWEMTVLEQTQATYFFNVTRCPYYEKYRELGLEEFGMELSCCREKYFARGFNPNLSLVRKKTIMGGFDHCSFRYYLGSK